MFLAFSACVSAPLGLAKDRQQERKNEERKKNRKESKSEPAKA